MSTPVPETGVEEIAETLGAALRRVAAALKSAGLEAPADEARRLVSFALGLAPVDVLLASERPLTPMQRARLARDLARRVAREPLSRIAGEREFYGRSFAISPATLDPRPDSETVIDAALAAVRREGWESAPLRVVDVGTGSGCLLLTLLAELPQATGVGSDISPAALVVAAGNAARLGLEHRVRWREADALEGIDGTYHIFVANPPYVRSGNIAGLEREVRDFDPRIALDGGADGLNLYRRLMPRIRKVVPDGWIVLETGHDQAAAVAGLLVETLSDACAAPPVVHRELGGRERCVALRTRS
jgi:release factor glutamine methyltransferase